MRIHLVGIGGIAMGNLAAMLKEAGHQVSGSDNLLYPPMSEKLADWGIEAHPFSVKNLKRIDLAVIGNAVSRGNPEVEHILNHGVARISLPQALSTFFLKGRQPIVVAGTHGKTTTTFLIDHILQTAGKSAGLFAGGIRQDGQAGFRIGKPPYFVIEGDEYDSAFFDKGAKFLHYAPRCLVLTSVEYDHADIYANEERYRRSFELLLRLIPSQGLVVACSDSKAVRYLLRSYQLAPVVCYSGQRGRAAEMPTKRRTESTTKKSTERPTEKSTERPTEKSTEGLTERLTQRVTERVALDPSGTGNRRVIFPYAGVVEPFPLSGRHNRLNALAAILIAKHLKIAPEVVREALISFPGVLRRQQVRLALEQPASGCQLAFIEDFAHHPTAVAACLQSAREDYPNRRLTLLFEPRSASSHSSLFQKSYIASFRKADQVYLTDLYNRAKLPASQRLNVKGIVEELNRALPKERPKAWYAANPELLLGQLQKNFRPSPKGDVLLALSNGSFGGIYSKLEKLLSDAIAERSNL